MGKVTLRMTQSTVALPLFTLAFLAGCDNADSTTSTDPLPRPVTYLTLEAHAPQPQSLVTGSVESWKSEQVGFQVNGRVRFVHEPGANILGRILDSHGKLLESGAISPPFARRIDRFR